MADGSLTLEAIANFNRMDTAISRSQTRIEALEKAVARLEGGQSRYERSANRGFDRLIVNAAKVAATYFSIHQAINAVTQAIQDQIDKSKLAADMNRTFQESREEFLAMTGGLDADQQRRLERQVLRVGARAGFDEQMIFPTFQAAFSGTDEADVNVRAARSLEVFKESSEMFGRSLQENRSIQGGILQIQRMTQGTMAETTGRVNRFVEQSVAESPGAVIGKLAQTISAQIAISGAKTPAERQRVADDAMAVLTSLAAVGFDPEMAMARTAAVNFQVVMKDILESGRGGQSAMDLIELFKERGLDPDDPTIKFKGKAFFRELQPELLRDMEDTAGSLADILKQQVEVYRRPIGETVEVVKARQRGDEDLGKAMAVESRSIQARSQEEFRRTRALGGTVRNILFGIDDKTGAYADFGYFQRALRRTPFIASAEDPFDPGRLRMSTEMVARDLARLGGIEIEASLAREPMRAFRELAAAPVAPDSAAALLQDGLKSLLRLMEVQQREQERLFQELHADREAARQQRQAVVDEYRRLTSEFTDIAEGRANSNTSAQRRDAHTENAGAGVP